MTNGGKVLASTAGQGNSGAVDVTVTDSIFIEGENSSGLSSVVGSTVEELAVGNAGNVTINTNSLGLANGGRISASTFGRGDAGSVNINATGTIELDGENSLGEGSRISSVINNQAVGNSEGITVNTQNLILTNGGSVIASTLGQGNAGDITINAAENIFLDGETSESLSSNIASVTSLGAVGNAGRISVAAGDLSLTDGGLIFCCHFWSRQCGICGHYRSRYFLRWYNFRNYAPSHQH